MRKILLSLTITLICNCLLTGCYNPYEITKVENDINDDYTTNLDDNKNDNIDNTQKNDVNKNKSEFELAIENYKNAKSMTIEFYSEYKELDSDYNTKSKSEIFIDYKNGLIDIHKTYYYVSLIPSSDKEKDTHEYYDIKNNKVYNYDNQCKTWYYYNMPYKEDNGILEYLDEILSLKESNAKIVGNIYHFSSKDIMIEDNKITWFRIDGNGSNRGYENNEYTFKSFNDTTVTLPSEVKNAVPERDLCD